MRLYVLARNYQEFKQYCWDKGFPTSHATYVANVERLRGSTFTPSQIVRLPGHRDNINWPEIEEHVRIVTAVNEGAA